MIELFFFIVQFVLILLSGFKMINSVFYDPLGFRRKK
jgi:hypothetical protein